MDNRDRLTFFERFDLSLSLLVIHLTQEGIPSEIISTRPDPGTQLDLACDLIGECLEFSRTIRESQNREREAIAAAQDPSWSWLREDEEHVDELADFIGELSKAEREAASLSQRLRIEQQDYDRFGDRVAREIRRFRASVRFEDMQGRYRLQQRFSMIKEISQSAAGDWFLGQKLEVMLSRLLYILLLIRHTGEMGRALDCERLLLLAVHCYYCCRQTFMQLDDLRRYFAGKRELVETMAWASSVLKIEATRALKQELFHLDHEKDRSRFQARLERGFGILQNGFDNAVRQVLETLAPMTSLGAVFEDRTVEYREAQNLVTDLNRLLQATRRLEAHPDEESLTQFLDVFDFFREFSSPALYYRDQVLFEQFEEEISRMELDSREFVLHRFRIFLSTLLAEVGNRTVLHQNQRLPEPSTGIKQLGS